MTADHDARVSLFVSSLLGLPNNETTYAELVKQKDYATGYVGTQLVPQSISVEIASGGL